VAPEADNRRIALTTQQISQIASIFDPTIEEELKKARAAWMVYQSTRKRDAVYPYLSAVFEIVTRWKHQHRAKASAHQALIATKQDAAIGIDGGVANVVGNGCGALSGNMKLSFQAARSIG
jgi:hypothetical protein